MQLGEGLLSLACYFIKINQSLNLTSGGLSLVSIQDYSPKPALCAQGTDREGGMCEQTYTRGAYTCIYS